MECDLIELHIILCLLFVGEEDCGRQLGICLVKWRMQGLSKIYLLIIRIWMHCVKVGKWTWLLKSCLRCPLRVYGLMLSLIVL
uniref:Pentatricopeptide repeat-containing protein n=1 Tax=Rhizophora mucronata TaxID=61149 RepID=A0A2P2KX80_RHIMU